MRATHKVPLWVVVLAIVGIPAYCNVRLGPFLAQLKDGPFANEIGTGGILALAFAGTQDEAEGDETITRSARAVHSAADRPLLINVTESDSESEVIQNIVTNLNNVSSPTTRRMVRQVAILDQLSCLPKLICGISTREPSRRTSVINDYGYLIKYLFERDDDGAQEDEEEDDEDEDDDLGRDGGLSLSQKKKLKGKKGSTDDDDEDVSDSAEEFLNDEPSIIKAIEEDKLEDIAQDELLENEPELLMFAMAEMKDKYKNKKKRIPGINKEYGLDHSDVVGYNKEDYKIIENPLLNTDRATAILKDRSKYTLSSIKPSDSDGKGWNIGDKKLNFEIGDASQEESQGLLGSMMPSFLVQKRKVVVSKPNKDDPFDGDPFFEDFKRSLSTFQVDKSDRQTEDIRKEFVVQRRNSRFTNHRSFFQRKSDELHNSTDPLAKYEIAEEVGRQTKSSRQCRMLFAKCPYTTDEITTMIDNVKKLVTSQKTVGDKVVTLKKNDASSGTTQSDSLLPSKSSGSAIEVPLNGGGGGGITQISHQLDNGDKVEITLNIKQKGEKIMQVVQVPISPDPELVKANKTLHDMRRALQAIAKLHNQTELQHVKRQKPQSISVAELLQEQLNERIKQGSPQDSSAPVNSAESTSDSKSTEDINLTRPPAATLPGSIFKIKKNDYKEVKLSTKSKPQSSQEDDAGDEDEDDDEDDDEDEDEDDDPSGRPSNHMHFYRTQPIPTQPPAKNRFSPFYFNHGLQPAPQNRPRVPPRPQQRLPPRPAPNRKTGPVYLNHGPKPPPKPRPAATTQAKTDDIKRRSSITKSETKPPETGTKSPPTTAKVQESKGGKRRSSLTTTQRPKAAHTRRTSSTSRPKNSNKRHTSKPKAATKRPQPERKHATSPLATPTTTTQSTETTTPLSTDISLNKFFIEDTPMAFPKPNPRQDKVTSVRPPLQLPPRPGKYKIHRKKGTNSNQKGQPPAATISKRRG